jgi:hypothetical protein
MDNCIPVYTHGRHANEVKEHEMMLINKPHKIFNSVEEALATIELMSFVRAIYGFETCGVQ